eukprot:gene51022-60025_t
MCPRVGCGRNCYNRVNLVQHDEWHRRRVLVLEREADE